MAADDIRREEGIGLAEHAGFGFNATDTPGDDADTIDHRCMRVGTKDGVGEPHAVFFPDAARQVFHVDLVNDAVAGRDDADGFKRALRPFDEAITLGVAREFDFLIALHGIGPVVDVDLDRVIDHHVNGYQRLDLAGGQPLALGGGTHGREVVQGAKADQILQHDTDDDEGDFGGALAVGLPGGEVAHMFFGDAFAVAEADQRFEHDAHADGQSRNLAESCCFKGRQ